MQNSLRKHTLLLLATSFCLSACSVINNPTPGPLIPGLAQTLAAETLTARQNVELGSGSQSLQSQAQGPLPTYEYVPTSTPNPTGTPIPQLTPFLGDSRVGLAEKCINAAAFIKDVSVPDNELMKKGQRFIKTWLFKNSGSCTWTPEYAIVFIWGDRMNGETPKPLGKTIDPGQTIEVSTELQAPNEPGQYQGSWTFQDADGNQFGTGSQAKQFFWVSIIVPGKVGGFLIDGCISGG